MLHSLPNAVSAVNGQRTETEEAASMGRGLFEQTLEWRFT
jgi:hypothetical protein